MKRGSYDMEFLKKKGFFERMLDMRDGDISYKYDPENKLAYFEYENKSGDKIINEVLRSIKPIRNFEYYWFWREGRLCVYRNFGENRWFIYNLTHSRIDEYKKSKQDKLKKFNPKSMGVLFDVKDVINTFYRNLWDIRKEMTRSIKGDISDQERILAAQRTIDRLIFTYFIGQKGLLKVINDRGEEISFDIKKLFEFILKRYKGDSKEFYRFLNKLFFGYLNSEKNEDLRIEGVHGYSLKVPFLNGGLFREHEIEGKNGTKIKERELEIAYNWEGLISELNRYNWILGDYVPTEEGYIIGNLTPEVLGHIYEKFVITISELDEIKVDELTTTREGELRRGNKKIGAYYTPEEITRYIAGHTIWPFARDKLNIDEKYETFDAFFDENKDNGDNNGLFESIRKELKKIKILDPAVGSGAFLMAAGDLLVDLRRKCGDETDEYEMRREIIVNNLYGVDIMEGAVDICKLRLWLWLISGTTEKLEPLPNIDYNIRCGNSLIGYVDTKQVAELKAKRRGEKKIAWKSLTDRYLTLDNYAEDSILNLFRERNKLIRKYRTTTGKKEEKLREELRGLTDEFNEILNDKLLQELKGKGIKIGKGREAREFTIDDLMALKPFHWVMEFSDVFEKGRFDVVVGNPPYIRSIRLKESDPIAWEIYRNEYTSASYKEYDIYLPILERSSKLLSKYGRLGFIMPNKWLHAQMGERARTYFHEKSLVSEIINFKSLQVFVGVTTYTMLIFFANRQNDAIFVRQFAGDPESGVEKAMGNLRGPDWESGRVKYESLTSAPWSFSLGKKGMLMDKLRRIPNKFGNYFRVFKGTGTDADPVFFVKKVSEDKNTVTIYSRYTDKEHIVEKGIVKPSVKGKDISNYAVIEKNNLLIFPYNGKELIPEETMKTEYPLAWEYLQKCRYKLEKREKGRFKGPNFYCYGRPQNHEFISDKKIIIPAIVNFAEAAYDVVGYHMIDSVYGIRKIADIELDDYYILALLNSRLLTFFLMETGTNLRGGYFTMKSAYLEPFPIPDATKLDKSEGSIYHRIIENVKEIIHLRETSPEESTDRVLKLDEEINQGLYELYGLNDEEATIIEETVKGRCFRD